jgi:glutaredoxin
MLPYSMAASDISVVLDSFSSNREGDSTASIPSKTYYLMSAGSVIYAESDNTSELNELIKNNKIGLCDSTQDPEIFINFIKECLNNRELLAELKENSRFTSLKFTKKNANMLYNEILKID